MDGNTAQACGLGGGPCAVCASGVPCTGGKCTAAPVCSNCPTGCCDTAGACQSGTASFACGTGGVQCVVCPPGTVCGNGTCAPPQCDCPAGCCQGPTCMAGNTDTSCGTGSQPCANCLGIGQRCSPSTQQCTPGTAGCGVCPPTSCCNGTVCEPGDADAACGSGGLACVDCLASGQKCDPALRTCQGCSGCDTGCCYGSLCQAGDDNAACGSGGKPCTDCVALGQKCGLEAGERKCVPLCPDCLTGCCFGPSCVAGTGDSACGAGGEACKDCAAFGQVCLAGSRSCSGTVGSCPNCFSGCCQGPTCVSGNEVLACGKDGDPCVNCLALDPKFVCHPTRRTCGPPQDP